MDPDTDTDDTLIDRLLEGTGPEITDGVTHVEADGGVGFADVIADLQTLAAVESGETIPEALRADIVAAAPGYLGGPRETTSVEEPDDLRRDRRYGPIAMTAIGWATAAALLVAMVVRSGDSVDRVGPPSLVDLKARPDTLVLGWSAGTDPSGRDVTGEVVWSDSEQSGYMTFTGLSANDPADEQYQLWIFDAERDDRYPVDGGVFDVGQDGTTVVPIRAKLAVTRPTLFAVTVESPGGVVVSSRERLALLAAAEDSA
ncbi:MAG: anti-sigma factor [Planctomycetota bacterium]